MKTKSMLSIASLVLLFSACSNEANTTANNSNIANNSNTAVLANSNQPAKNGNAPSSLAATPSAKFDGDKIQGELQTGKTQSVILYFGQESGDYAGYCFTNDSEAGRTILAACKDRAQCEITAKLDYEAGCKVPGLEADLSNSGKILQVGSARAIATKN